MVKFFHIVHRKVPHFTFLGHTVGQAIGVHPVIEKISFTGSGATGRKLLRASADTNLKNVSLEMGGKNPTIIFDDADLDQAVKWTAHGILYVPQNLLIDNRD